MTPNALYQHNTALCRRHFPAIAPLIDQATPPAAGQFFTGADNLPNLRLSMKNGAGLLLHQPDQTTECQPMLARIPQDSHGSVVLLGMGLGHAILEIARQRPRLQQILVVERNPDLFRAAMMVTDLTPLFTDPRLTLILGEHTNFESLLDKAAITLQLEDIHLLHHQPSFAWDPGYHDCRERLFSTLNLFNVAGSSAMQQGPPFLRNRFANFATLPHHHLLNELEGAAKNQPAVLIANGPSLDHSIPALKRHRHRALYFAVDSALPTLLKHGIIPDFIGALDANPVIYEKIAACAPQAQDSSLLTVSQVAPDLIDIFPVRDVFMAMSDAAVDKHAAALLGIKPCSTRLATVAHLNLQAALLMQADPIILIGQDLSYPEGNRTHSSATTLTCQELLHEARASENDYLPIPGVGGTTVYTDRGLLNAKSTLEEMLEGQSVTIYNATSQGATLGGTVEKDLDQIMARLPETSFAAHVLPTSYNTTQGKNRQIIVREYQRLLRECRALATQLEKIPGLIRKARKIRRTSHMPAAEQQTRVLALLDTLDRIMAGINQHHAFWLLLQDITLKGLQQCNRITRQLNLARQKKADWHITSRLQLAWFQVAARAQKTALTLLRETLQENLRFLADEQHLVKGDKQQAAAMVTFYLQHGKIKLAHQWQKKMQADTSPESLLHQGIIAGFFRQQSRQENLFHAAQQADPSCIATIQKTYRQMGEYFLARARECPALMIDHTSALRLLGDGLRYGNNHRGCLEELCRHAEQDLTTITAAPKGEKNEDVTALLAIWGEILADFPLLADAMPAKTAVTLLLETGRLAASGASAADGLKLLTQALQIAPKDGAIHFQLAKYKLANGAFREGLEHLQKAVEVDKSYGYYWGVIGDVLHQTQQYDEACIAYERGFLACPEETSFLRRIGDCYQAMGKTEAAAEAYRYCSPHAPSAVSQ